MLSFVVVGILFQAPVWAHRRPCELALEVWGDGAFVLSNRQRQSSRRPSRRDSHDEGNSEETIQLPIVTRFEWMRQGLAEVEELVGENPLLRRFIRHEFQDILVRLLHERENDMLPSREDLIRRIQDRRTEDSPPMPRSMLRRMADRLLEFSQETEISFTNPGLSVRVEAEMRGTGQVSFSDHDRFQMLWDLGVRLQEARGNVDRRQGDRELAALWLFNRQVDAQGEQLSEHLVQALRGALRNPRFQYDRSGINWDRLLALSHGRGLGSSVGHLLELDLPDSLIGDRSPFARGVVRSAMASLMISIIDSHRSQPPERLRLRAELLRRAGTLWDGTTLDPAARTEALNAFRQLLREEVQNSLRNYSLLATDEFENVAPQVALGNAQGPNEEQVTRQYQSSGYTVLQGTDLIGRLNSFFHSSGYPEPNCDGVATRVSVGRTVCEVFEVKNALSHFQLTSALTQLSSRA